VHRGKTSGRSDDTDENVQRKRQEVYKNETLPVAAHYQKAKKLATVDGMGEIDSIFERLCSYIDKKMK
jgi:adenylate kinase